MCPNVTGNGNSGSTKQAMRVGDLLAQVRWRHNALDSSAERSEPVALEFVPVKEVISVKRDQAAVRVDDMYAGFFDASDIEGVRIDELHDDHPEDVFIRYVFGDQYFRQAAEEFSQAARA